MWWEPEGSGGEVGRWGGRGGGSEREKERKGRGVSIHIKVRRWYRTHPEKTMEGLCREQLGKEVR